MARPEGLPYEVKGCPTDPDPHNNAEEKMCGMQQKERKSAQSLKGGGGHCVVLEKSSTSQMRRFLRGCLTQHRNSCYKREK